MVGFSYTASHSYNPSPGCSIDFRHQHVFVVVGGVLFVYFAFKHNSLEQLLPEIQRMRKPSLILEAPGQTWGSANSLHRRR